MAIQFTPFLQLRKDKPQETVPIQQVNLTQKTVVPREAELPEPPTIQQPKAEVLREEIIQPPQVTDTYNLIDWNNQSKEGKGRAARQFLERRLGLTDYQAAALVGSFMRESGLNINAENKAEKAGKNPAVKASQYGIGIGQWTHDRHDDLVNWITQYGNTLESQLTFAADEIERKYPQFLNALKQASNSDEASDYVFAMYTGGNYTKANKSNIKSIVDQLDKRYGAKHIELYGKNTNNHSEARKKAAREALKYQFGGILGKQPEPYQKQYDLSDNPFNLYKHAKVEKPTVEKHALTSIPGINMDNLNTIADRLKAEGFNKEQSAAILATVAEESKANPLAVGDNGAARGLFQWHGNRFIADNTLESQINLIIKELRDIKNVDGWGPSTKYKRSAAIEAFNSGNLENAITALTYNFIRPKNQDGATKRRFQLAQQIYNELL